MKKKKKNIYQCYTIFHVPFMRIRRLQQCDSIHSIVSIFLHNQRCIGLSWWKYVNECYLGRNYFSRWKAGKELIKFQFIISIHFLTTNINSLAFRVPSKSPHSSNSFRVWVTQNKSLNSF